LDEKLFDLYSSAAAAALRAYARYQQAPSSSCAPH
jgi:hypothetical protein